MDFQSREVAALHAALAAAHRSPGTPQRRDDVLDCIALVTNAMARDGHMIEVVITGVRRILRDHPEIQGIKEEQLVKHLIVQYYARPIGGNGSAAETSAP